MPRYRSLLVSMALLLFCAQASSTQVYVMQRAVPLDHRFEISLLAMGRIDSKYIGENGAGLAVAYHLRHNIALQLSGSWLFWQSQSGVARDLSQIKDRAGNDITNTTGEAYAKKPPLGEYFRDPWFALLEMQIAPVYGKISVSNQKLGHFQIFGLVGLGASGVELIDPLQSVAQAKDVLVAGFPRNIAALGSLGVGAQVLFTENLGISLEIKDLVQVSYVTKAEITNNVAGYDTTSEVSQKWMAQAGVKYVF